LILDFWLDLFCKMFAFFNFLKRNFTLESSMSFSPYFFCLAFSPHSFILLFYSRGAFIKLFFFSISSSDIGLVVNWESWFSSLELYRAHDQDD
jgi:hypothetical protein